MTDIKDLLKKMISLPGLSGYEDPVREVIAEAWRPLVDELTVSKLGSLHGLRKGTGPEPRPRILLAAHMDAIGLMVTRVTPEGFIHFTEVGGIDPRILVSTPVIVYGRRELPGIVAQPLDRLLPPSLKGNPVGLEYLIVDTGLPGEEVNALVRPGDLISFATEPLDLPGDLLAGHTLDNRASVAAVTVCLDELQRAAPRGMCTPSPPCRKKRPWPARSPRPSTFAPTSPSPSTSPLPTAPASAITAATAWAKAPFWPGVPTPTRPSSTASKKSPSSSISPSRSKSIRAIPAPTPWACRSSPRASPRWSSASRCATCTPRSR